MSRYTCSYRVKVAPGQLYPLLVEVLESCNFEITYEMHDYLVARENPGQTTFAKLVIVEVLIDNTTATQDEIQVNLVVKNDELPLQKNNHCHQLFTLIQQAVAENHQWKLIENVSS